ncbi:hypothetical protein ES288_A04G100300v1 [Gossypium darwinii]|uniref:Reverse transcriptase zinc-binding domain-containing protein n=1 Tax=Gossypium darwinii TaxID=34276 RepID=A0A5D2GW15_GOSDA|nr:hypothetical protein ES288_A04G100300v1 [Gossypium darwinii]
MEILKRFYPTAYNLYNRKIPSSPICPRCGFLPESMLHVMTVCGPVVEVWNKLGLSWVLTPQYDNFWDWFEYILWRNCYITCGRIIITLWSLWFARNKFVIEGKRQTIQDISSKIQCFM